MRTHEENNEVPNEGEVSVMITNHTVGVTVTRCQLALRICIPTEPPSVGK